MTLTTRLLLIIVIQTLVLAGMIAKRQWTLTTGTPVLLETRPIDPRSLFRGDYVTFNYAISRLRLDELDGDEVFQRHDTIYVVLEPGAPYWRPRAVFHELPPGQVALRGRVQYAGEQWWNPETGKTETLRHVGVRYGIEDYFVPEGEGRKLERPAADEVVALGVAVDRFGNGAIQSLLINGVERYRETLF
ncbi:MAG: GDYXXLXY domain-containing protein [Pseudomonadota bacterium]